MSSLISTLATLQNALTGSGSNATDTKYYTDYLCFFELVCTSQGSPAADYLFPLMYSPSQYTMSEPFTVEPTNTLDGGLYVEESGVIQRRISITAHQGVTPHLLATSGTPTTLPPLSQLNYHPNFDVYAARPAQVLSGQKHFQYLQQTVFRAYSDLKRDSKTAAGTHLYWHNPQDDEHFEVVPMLFTLSRSNSAAMTYPYQIELLCIGTASASVLTVSTDTGIIGKIEDFQRTASNTLATLRGTVNDVVAVVGSIKLLGQQYVSIIDQATSIVNAVDRLVSGVTSIIDVPYAAVAATIGLIDSTMQLYDDAVEAGQAFANFPEPIRQRWATMRNALHLLLTHPAQFSQSVQRKIAAENLAIAQRGVTQTAVARIKSFADVTKAGTANLPGDADIDAGQDDDIVAAPDYQSIFAYTVRQGDTLASVANTFLGSTVRYRDICILNGIALPIANIAAVAAPTITDASQSGSVIYVGEVLQIPSTQPPLTLRGSSVVLGAKSTDSQDAQVLGRDMLLVPTPSNATNQRFDLALSLQGDGTYDITTVQGAPLVAQAVTQHVTQTLGSNPLYPNVGLAAVIPTGMDAIDYQQARFRISAAILADPRVGSIQSLTVTTAALGTVALQAVVQTAQGTLTTSTWAESPVL